VDARQNEMVSETGEIEDPAAKAEESPKKP
jgi:hypothetical protein